MGLVGFGVYVGLYSLLKIHTQYATLIGSISGAVPPVVGYVAVSNRVDAGALLLFLLLVLWQMPHFYSIAIYSFDDYKAASIPVLPIVKGIPVAKVHMVLYIIAFMLSTAMLTLCGYMGYIYLTSASILGGAWLLLCLKGFKTTNDKLWARKMFAVSLVTIIGICIAITVMHI